MASMTDLSGMDVTTDARLVPLWDRVIRGILSHSAATGDDLNAVIAADRDFAFDTVMNPSLPAPGLTP